MKKLLGKYVFEIYGKLKTIREAFKFFFHFIRNSETLKLYFRFQFVLVLKQMMQILKKYGPWDDSEEVGFSRTLGFSIDFFVHF